MDTAQVMGRQRRWHHSFLDQHGYYFPMLTTFDCQSRVQIVSCPETEVELWAHLMPCARGSDAGGAELAFVTGRLAAKPHPFGLDDEKEILDGYGCLVQLLVSKGSSRIQIFSEGYHFEADVVEWPQVRLDYVFDDLDGSESSLAGILAWASTEAASPHSMFYWAEHMKIQGIEVELNHG